MRTITTITGMPTTSGTRTSTRPARNRAERTLVAQRLHAPATRANTARNARAELGRHRRWAPARDALWRLLEANLAIGARVAILGAGNGDTVPLDRIADRASQLALVDLDGPAIRAARAAEHLAGAAARSPRSSTTSPTARRTRSPRPPPAARSPRHPSCPRRRSPARPTTS
jgi:hypothetical protein